MPKRRKPFWDDDRQQWAAWVYLPDGGKRRRRLGVTDPKDERGAWAAYELEQAAAMAGAPLGPIVPASPLRELFGRFLDHVQATAAPATYSWYKLYLKAFGAHAGRITVDQLRPHHLTRWLDAEYQPPKSRHHPARAVKAALRWAEEEGLVDRSPLGRVRVGKSGRLDQVVTADQRAAVRATARDEAFADLLTAMEQTGARVEEVRRIEARHVLRDAAGVHVAWVLPMGERKRGEVVRQPRVIPLTAAAAALSARLCERRPEGPILRNSKGRPWTGNAIRCRFRARRKKDPTLPTKLRGTMYRHAAAQDLSAAGANLHLVAQALGHTDLDMLARHYLHALGIDQLREMMEKVRGAG